ncbi:MotE family protein [Neobacillus sp. SM06]|uniref:MotE family protein n=1 Tax=Neobacillus sp. SM06 TaxID=3422492 RepID=UPI003D2D66CA
MVKKQMNNEVTENEIEQKKPFQWFVFVILIPLLFAIAVALIVSTFAGINVFSAAKDLSGKLPFVSSVFPKNAPSTANKKAANDLISLQAQVKDDEAKISQLQAKLQSKDQEIQKAQLENNRLQQQIDSLNASQKESKRALSDLVTTYETMSPKKAAPIIAKMTDAEALKILSSVKPEILASIMENMDPAQAARFTERLTNQNAASQKSTP